MAEKNIKIDSAAKRIALAALAVLLACAAFFAAKWCAANAMASHTIYPEVADFALAIAPDDPQTHYTTAVLQEKNFSAADVQKAIEEYERATALSPNDFRTWLALGRARERTGDQTGAENAVRRAQQLAPNYSEVNWTLGNILLRAGKRSEAFQELRRAAEADKDYVNPATATAWQIFGGDLAQIREAVGSSPQLSAALVEFLARDKRFDDAVQVWNALPAEARTTTYKDNGKTLIEQMLNAGKYRAALETLVHSAATDADFAAGKIYNGGFEANVNLSGARVFDWQIAAGAQPIIGIDDAQKSGGNQSLTIIFNSPTGRDFRAILQIVALDASGARYAFSAQARAELKTNATVYWEIFDVTNGKVLAQTAPVGAATREWTNLRAEFIAPTNTEAVAVRLAREPCKSSLCPISGRVWFDELKLDKLQN
jgi:tetratricopeptide (TPR) repeat protein